MSKHILVISIGPVQKFISAARRTRDLWFGSYALSEISKAAAKVISERGGNLVFPAPISASDLDKDSPLNVANVILSELDGADPKAVADAARAAAQQRWLAFADDARKKAGADICDDIWREQVDDVIEFNAAWVAATTDYSSDRARLMRLLAGRKQCFDFAPAHGRPGIPKSSLDGLRESVLVKGEKSIRLAEGEQLDVVGVVKRLAEGNTAYPSVARIAADPWLRGLTDDCRRELADACRRLQSGVIARLDVGSYPQFKQFPLDGTVCFPSRYSEMKKDGETDDSVEDLRGVVRSLHAEESDPYLAVLVADGDQVGKALSGIPDADGHRKFSQALARFSSGAAKIISDHHGVAVYCGGDDVLALVPVDKALACAAKLAQEFHVRMKDVSAGASPTLSVGVAIGHFMEPLEDLLEYGRAAESHAKNPVATDGGQALRDGLAVHLHKRGGGPVFFRDNWGNKPEEHLLTLAENLNAGTLSHRIAADLERLACVYDGWPGDTVKQAITKDTLRVLAAKNPRDGGDGKAMADLNRLVETMVGDAVSLRQLASGILIARQLASASRQAAGKRAKGELD
ncbi:MAG: type III-B CRISPR-associated protein Cas10/Cmr2 [Phycisphaerae bacterium]